MSTRKMVRFSVVALVGFACVLVTEARAQLAPALTAPLSCSAALNGATLTVQAGADGLSFPHDVPCPSPASGTCSEYTYRFTYTGGNISHSLLSVSADLGIFAVSPDASIEVATSSICGSGDTTTKVGVNVCEQRQIRFNEDASTVNAAVIVTRSAPRVSTAGARKGSAEAFCLIQGPGVPGNITAAVSVDANLLVANGHCPVKVTQASDAEFTSVALLPQSPCTITISDTAPVIDGEPVQIPPGKFVTFGLNSCSVTKTKFLGGRWVTVCVQP